MITGTEQKNILIIGGSSGIGKALARQLSVTQKVYATFNTTSEVSDPNANLSFHYCNVLDDTIDLHYLPEQLHGLVYCPGSINLKPLARIQPEDFINDYKLSVVGAVKIIQQVLQRLKVTDNASIVLFSSVAASQGFNFHSIVSSSKGAIEGLTKALAAEFAPSIRVNCVAPSITDTPLSSSLLNTESKKEANASRHALKRVGAADDIANMVSFLLSDQSSWITGQVFKVDGGISSIR